MSEVPARVRTRPSDPISATERWFLRRGTPHFIEGYTAREDVFTRTLPFLLIVVLLEVLGAAKLDWPWWLNTLALLGGAGVLLGGWALVNRVRGRRALHRPDDIGAAELGAFVILPALLPAVFGRQYVAATTTAVINLLLLGIAYLVTSYGLLPLVRWALGQMIRQLGTIGTLFGRALPLVLLFSVALFVNTEMWQVAAAIDGTLFLTIVIAFVLIGTVFLVLRLPTELKGIDRGLDHDRLVEGCRGTPMEEAAEQRAPDAPATLEHLTRRQRGNILLVLFVSQAVQVLVVTLSITAFYLAFGLVAIRPPVRKSWLGDLDPRVISEWTWFQRPFEFSHALIHAAGLIGSVAGLMFAVSMLTDSTYREEFFDDVTGEVRQTLAVRTVYLQEREAAGDGAA